MIKELTAEQEKELLRYKEKWLKIGLCTDPADKPRAEKSIIEMYDVAGYKKPEFMWFDSPYSIENFINKEKGNKKKVYHGTWFDGQMEAYWVAYYLFCEYIGVKYEEKSRKLLHLHAEIAQSCCWVYPFVDLVLACNRPSQINMKDNRLHCETGPSIAFRDGYELYTLNGVRMKKEDVMTPAEEFSAERVAKETNVEVRRELLRKIGIERFLAVAKHKVLDRMDDYELLSLELTETIKDAKYLKMTNPSINVFHVEGVGRECKTVQDALNWRAKNIITEGEDWSPSIIT